MDALLQRLEPRLLLLGMAGMGLLLAVGLFFTVVFPDVKAYRAASHSRALLQNVARTGDQVASKLAAIEQDVEKLGRQLHGDMMHLPEKELEGFIIGRLQEVSWRHNVELISVRPSKGKVVQIFREMLFDVEVSGEYFDLYDWLRELGRELGFVVVKHYVIRPLASEDATNPNLSVRLTMVSYRKT